MEGFRSRDRYHDLRVAAAWATGLLALAACGGSASSAPSSSRAVQHTAASASRAANPQAKLTFDYLGGGSKVIQVYLGPNNTLHDRTSDGTFLDGEEEPVECETEGRTVTSHPEVGEQYRQSDEWYEIRVGEHTYWVTAVYADIQGNPPHC